MIYNTDLDHVLNMIKIIKSYDWDVRADWIYQVLSSGVKVDSHEIPIDKGFMDYLGDLGKVCIGEIC